MKRDQVLITPSRHRDKDEIKALLQDRIDDLVLDLFPQAKRGNGEYRIGNLLGEPGGSLAIASNGSSERGVWIDHANPGEDRGDVITLIQRAYNLTFPQALEWACDWLGISWDVGPQQVTKTRRRSSGGRIGGPAASSDPHRAHIQPPERPPQQSKPDPAPRTTTPSEAVMSGTAAIPLPTTQEGKVVSVANERHLAERQKALAEHQEVLAWLHARQLTDATIQHFRLGLYNSRHVKNALSFPLFSHDGVARGRYLNSRVPGVTTGVDEDKPEEKRRKDWAKGQAATYWATPSEGRQDLLIVEGARDAWRVWQEIQGSELEDSLAIITSTHGSVIPEDWKQPTFFAGWRRVYLGQDADDTGDKLAQQVRELTHREALRARPPEGHKDWTDWLNSGASSSDFAVLLKVAPVLDEPLVETTTPHASNAPGYYAAEAVEINGAWTRGHLYYPYRVLSKTIDEKKQEHHKYETLVLRSDGQAFSVRYLPAPEGTPLSDRVLALGDGTYVRRRPVVDADRQSFRLPAINRFRQARKQGRSALSQPPERLLEDVERQLRRAVILPYEHDYALLAYVVLASYVQRIFAAIPLVLINGVAGSGKSELAARMADLSANGVVVTGQTSAATAARVVDLTNGLVAFDDLEAIGQRSRGGEFSELIQQLKVSYKQATSRKSLTVMDRNGARIETLDFYGVKVMTNTAGVDDILGSRMLMIRTRKIDPNRVAEEMREFTTTEEDEVAVMARIRDELHIWAMEYAARVDEVYQATYARHTSRADEIAAPLRTIADVIDHPAMRARLGAALEAQVATRDEIENDEELLRAAVANLIRKGNYDRVSVQQIVLEMEALVGPDWGIESTTEIPSWKRPQWIGRALRQQFIVVPNSEERSRLFPGGVQTRVLRLTEEFVTKVTAELEEHGVELPAAVRDPIAFCRACPCRDCEYRATCNLQDQKQKKLPDERLSG